MVALARELGEDEEFAFRFWDRVLYYTVQTLEIKASHKERGMAMVHTTYIYD